MTRSTLCMFTKQTMGRVRRRTSTKQRSMRLVLRSFFHRCRGKRKKDNRPLQPAAPRARRRRHGHSGPAAAPTPAPTMLSTPAGDWPLRKSPSAFFRVASEVFPLPGRGQLHAGTAGLRQTNGNRLFGRGRAVLAFADVVHLLFHAFAGLGARRFSLACLFAGPLQRFFLWHRFSFSYPQQRCRIRPAEWTTLTLRAAALTCQ